jgi:Lrp/AsnC family transcriptional regulator for asnA, asnC and gidA
MMNKVYVLISVKRGLARPVETALRKIPEVVEASIVSGRYDVFAKLQGKDLSSITDAILDKIHKIEGVVRTETLIALSLDITGEEPTPLRAL